MTHSRPSRGATAPAPPVALAWALALVLSACGDSGFDERSELKSYRVLGISAEPAEVRSEGRTLLRALEYVPAGSGERFYVWAVCLYSLGALAEYACADPRLEVYIATDRPELMLDLGRDGFMRQIFPGLTYREFFEAALSESGESELVDPLGRSLDLSEGVSLQVRLVSGVTGVARMETARSITVRDGEGPANLNPTIQGVEIDGAQNAAAPTDSTLRARLRLAPNAAESYEAEGEARTERLLYSWYADGGALKRSRGADEGVDNEWTLPESPGEYVLSVVVRDGRGGIAMQEVRLFAFDPVTGPPSRDAGTGSPDTGRFWEDGPFLDAQPPPGFFDGGR